MQYFYMSLNFIIVAHSRLYVIVPAFLVLASMLPGAVLLHSPQTSSSSGSLQYQSEFTLGNYKIFVHDNGINITSNNTWAIFSPAFFIVNHGSTTYYSTTSVSGRWNNVSKVTSVLLNFQTAYGNMTMVAGSYISGKYLQIQNIGNPYADAALNFTTTVPVNATLSGFLQTASFNHNSSSRNVLSNYIYQMNENFGNGNIWVSWMQYTYSSTNDNVLYSVYGTSGNTATLGVMLKGIPDISLDLEMG